MRTHFGFTLFLLIALTFAVSVSGRAPSDSHDGFWWTRSPETFKLGFVSGYVMAIISARNALAFQCLASKNGGVVGPDELKACNEAPEQSHFPTFDNLRVGQLEEGVDEFYKDFRNKNLSIEIALRYVSDQLNGKPESELQSELARWRGLANK